MALTGSELFSLEFVSCSFYMVVERISVGFGLELGLFSCSGRNRLVPEGLMPFHALLGLSISYRA